MAASKTLLTAMGVVVGGGLAYWLFRPTENATKSGTDADSPDGANPLPESSATVPNGSFVVALSLGSPPKPVAERRFPSAASAEPYFDTALALMRGQFGDRGGAMSLNGPAYAGRLETWSAGKKQTIPRPTYTG